MDPCPDCRPSSTIAAGSAKSPCRCSPSPRLAETAVRECKAPVGRCDSVLGRFSRPARVELFCDFAAQSGLLDDCEAFVAGDDTLDVRVDVSRVDEECARVRPDGLVLAECRGDVVRAFGVCALADPLALD